MKIDLSAAFDTFLAECRELLDGMEVGLATLETATDDRDALNAVFRAAHTIKGSAGMFGLPALVGFTHAVETVLDAWRGGRIRPTTELGRVLLSCRDHMADLVACSSLAGGHDDPFLHQRDRQLRDALRQWVPEGAADLPDQAGAETAPGCAADASRRWLIRVGFPADFHRRGGNPLSLVRMAVKLGRDARIRLHAQAVPALSMLDPEDCLLHLDCVLDSEAPLAGFESVFEFVDEDCVVILPPGSDLEAGLRRLPATVDAVDPGHVDWLRTALADGPAATGIAGACAEATTTATAPSRAPRQAARPDALLRIRADRLDALINLVGELVVAGAAARSRSERFGDPDLDESMDVLAGLLEDMREQSLRLRMMPVGEVFERFRRTLREIAGELGKDVELVVRGGETELDKGMVDRLVEPLTHLVRNAVDHGIEDAAARGANGKPARGRVTLSARHEHGSVVIEVADDGAGLDPARILARARRNGLLDTDGDPPLESILNLIFEPGFSTAEQVTDLSGRGVGMDVVRRGIADLRGQIEVDSHPGTGTCFRIRLPLTLAIIDGFLVHGGGSRFILPLDVVAECIEAPALGARGGCMDLRGEVLPLLRLDHLFGLPEQAAKRRSVVVVATAGRRAGVVVDALLGEHQTVIKPLGELFEHVSGIAGSTVLPDGGLALVLDSRTLLDLACARDRDTPNASTPLPPMACPRRSTQPSSERTPSCSRTSESAPASPPASSCLPCWAPASAAWASSTWPGSTTAPMRCTSTTCSSSRTSRKPTST